MAEELADGEFWLPSDFLTDDDILMDLDFSTSASASAVSSTETESDEDDSSASALSRELSRSSLTDCANVKGWALSSSPQSTLCGCVGKEDGSSQGSRTPVSPQPEKKEKAGEEGATWDLLNKAAGEVARMKMRRETASSCAGTGFFDCSSAGKVLLCPTVPTPPKSNNTTTVTYNNNFPPLVYSQPQFPHLSHVQQFNRVPTRNNNGSNNSNNNRPLGLPPTAWPPLQTQNYQPVPPPMFFTQPAAKGTGVFLPRRVTAPAPPSPAPAETRKKNDTNGAKTKSGKGSQSQQRRNPRQPTTANPIEIQLPQEWIY